MKDYAIGFTGKKFKVGDEVFKVNFGEEARVSLFSGCLIRRICKHTVHLSWMDGKYHGYVAELPMKDGPAYPIFTQDECEAFVHTLVNSKD